MFHLHSCVNIYTKSFNNNNNKRILKKSFLALALIFFFFTLEIILTTLNILWSLLEQDFNNWLVCQRWNISQVTIVDSYFSENSTHDFAWSCLWKRWCMLNDFRRGERSDLLTNCKQQNFVNISINNCFFFLQSEGWWCNVPWFRDYFPTSFFFFQRGIFWP